MFLAMFSPKVCMSERSFSSARVCVCGPGGSGLWVSSVGFDACVCHEAVCCWWESTSLFFSLCCLHLCVTNCLSVTLLDSLALCVVRNVIVISARYWKAHCVGRFSCGMMIRFREMVSTQWNLNKGQKCYVTVLVIVEPSESPISSSKGFLCL